jgi:MerR family transcriptional regulator, copper efflux regulator
MTEMNIGEAAKQTGLPAKTIRYYEDIGLVCADRQTNGYRDYTTDHLEKLAFLKRSRAFGFSLEDCRTLLGLYTQPQRASADVKALATRHLKDLELKAEELQNLASTLKHLVHQCAGDAAPNCPIIDSLADAKQGSLKGDH